MWSQYPRDEDEIFSARKDFLSFLKALKQTAGVQSIDILAHSMGSRLPTNALDYINSVSDRDWPSLSDVVLAAPDIYTRQFQQETDALRKMVRRTTIYASDYDTVLACSHTSHSDQRVGQAGADIFVENGIDTIDASRVEHSTGFSKVWNTVTSSLPCWMTGHSYYISNLSVQNDIHELIEFGAEPLHRHGLVKINRADGKSYWALRDIQ